MALTFKRINMNVFFIEMVDHGDVKVMKSNSISSIFLALSEPTS
jgi:hypothetical protein